MILGVSTLMYATHLHIDSQSKADSIVMQFEDKMQDVKENDEPMELASEKTSIMSNEDELAIKDELSLDEVIGIVTIPSLGVKAPLTEGEEERLLKYSVGRIEKSAMPGETGNLVIGGHRNAIYSSFFKDLHKLVEGDLIHVKTLEGEYTYEVSKTDTVKPQEVWVMKKTDTPTITLITCTVGGKERTVVFGDLK